MKNFVNKLPRLLSFLVILILSTGTACGQLNGAKKTPSPTDSIRPPKRIIYEQEKGIFLNEKQELITLEKLLWKEQYRQDAVSMYYVNVALEERVKDLVEKNKAQEADLTKAEGEVMRAASNMQHYKTLYEQATEKNKELAEKNKKLTGLSIKMGVLTISATTALVILILPDIKEKL